jgi:hypothetical protein
LGWWKEGEDIVVGDEPVDYVLQAFDRILSSYQEEMGRKPTTKEIAATIKVALHGKWSDLVGESENKELSDVTIRTRSLGAKQKVHLGDYFAVPLTGGGYGYGNVRAVKGPVMLADLLDIKTGLLLPISEVIGAPVLTELVSGMHALTTREWPVIGSGPVRALDIVEGGKSWVEQYLKRLGQGRSTTGLRLLLEQLLARRRMRR